MNNQLNQETGLSKLITIIVMIGLIPVIVFFIGREYQKTVSVYDQESVAAVGRSSGETGKYSERESVNSAKPEFNSGVRGIAMVGPTCPAVQAGSEAECSDRPLEIRIKFINSYGQVFETVSLPDGTFSIELAPGTYIITQGGAGLLPSLSPVTVTVNEDHFTTANLNFDSGIR